MELPVMERSTKPLFGLAAALSVVALSCASADDPLYGSRPVPPVAPRVWAQPPYPQKVVVTEPLAPRAPLQETPPQETPPQESPAQGAPPAEAADPADAERARNETAFEDDYLRQKERLFPAHAGHWLAIVDGRLLPADARGRPAPAATLDECLAAADAANVAALHRFLFRIGEEGDVVYLDPRAPNQSVVGMGFKLALGIAATFDPASSAVTWTRAGKSRRFALDHGEFELRLSDPTGRQLAAARVSDSAGYAGFLLIDAALGDLLDAERFEIPGRALLRAGDQIRELRRAHLRVELPELDLDERVPAAVWVK
jgi:hypothetical protein